jgi:hypothetical protein
MLHDDFCRSHTHFIVNVSCSFITFISVRWWRVQTKCTCTSIYQEPIVQTLSQFFRRKEKKKMQRYFSLSLNIDCIQSIVMIDRTNWSIKVKKKEEKRFFTSFKPVTYPVGIIIKRSLVSMIGTNTLQPAHAQFMVSINLYDSNVGNLLLVFNVFVDKLHFSSLINDY